MEFTPGQKLTLKHPGNGHVFSVTVVRIGKKRVTCEHSEKTSDSGTFYPAHLKAYDRNTLEGMVQS